MDFNLICTNIVGASQGAAHCPLANWLTNWIVVVSDVMIVIVTHTLEAAKRRQEVSSPPPPATKTSKTIKFASDFGGWGERGLGMTRGQATSASKETRTLALSQ